MFTGLLQLLGTTCTELMPTVLQVLHPGHLLLRFWRARFAGGRAPLVCVVVRSASYWMSPMLIALLGWTTSFAPGWLLGSWKNTSFERTSRLMR